MSFRVNVLVSEEVWSRLVRAACIKSRLIQAACIKSRLIQAACIKLDESTVFLHNYLAFVVYKWHAKYFLPVSVSTFPFASHIAVKMYSMCILKESILKSYTWPSKIACIINGCETIFIHPLSRLRRMLMQIKPCRQVQNCSAILHCRGFAVCWEAMPTSSELLRNSSLSRLRRMQKERTNPSVACKHAPDGLVLSFCAWLHLTRI